jgi:hypothetical protein
MMDDPTAGLPYPSPADAVEFAATTILTSCLQAAPAERCSVQCELFQTKG